MKKVKIQEKSTLSVGTGTGIADNGNITRVDVFHVARKGYYYVPIYVADTVKKNCPVRQ